MKNSFGLTSEERRNFSPGNWQKDVEQKLPKDGFRVRLALAILTAAVVLFLGAFFVTFIAPTL